MARAAFQKTSFNGGELSPLLDGRADLGKYANGCTILENFLPTVQGPVYRRPGTRFVDDLGASDPVLVPFIYNREQTYMLAIGSVIRLYTGEGIVESSPGVPYTFGAGVWSAPPRRADGRSRLSYTQSGDVLFVCDAEGGLPLMAIKRLGALSWTVEPYELVSPPDGEFLGGDKPTCYIIGSLNPDPFDPEYRYLFHANRATNAADWVSFFSDANIRGKFCIDLSKQTTFYSNLGKYPNWAPGIVVTDGDIITNGGRYYVATENATLGSEPLTHTDLGGPRDSIMQYIGNGIVWFDIIESDVDVSTVFGWRGAKVKFATAPKNEYRGEHLFVYPWPGSFDVCRTIAPAELIDWVNPEGSGYVVRGVRPDNVSIFRDRLVISSNRNLWVSIAGDLPNFARLDTSGQVVADMGMSLDLLSGDLSPISWMAPSDRLILGSNGGERAIGEQNISNAFGPTNVKVDVTSATGSVDVGPALVGRDVLALDRTGRRLYRSTLGEGGQAFQNLSALADHIGLASPFVAMAWREIPTPVLFLASQAGELVGVTFDASQEVVAWNRHVLGGGGLVRDLGCIPSADGTRDNLWLLVERTVLGVQRFYLEVMPDEYRMGMPIEEARYLDCSLVYDGAPADVISGLDHLEGETVQAVGDGFALGEFTVSVGSITLPQEYSKISVGLHAPSRLRTMRVHLGADDGVAMGKKIRIHKAAIRLVDTVNIQTGWAFDKLVRQDFREPGMAMDTAIPGQTVERTMSFPGTYDGDGYVCIQQDLPLPCTIVALAIEFEVNS